MHIRLATAVLALMISFVLATAPLALAKAQAQEILTQEIHAQEIQAQEIQAQEILTQEIQAQEIQVQEIQAQEARAQATTTRPCPPWQLDSGSPCRNDGRVGAIAEPIPELTMWVELDPDRHGLQGTLDVSLPAGFLGLHLHPSLRITDLQILDPESPLQPPQVLDGTLLRAQWEGTLPEVAPTATTAFLGIDGSLLPAHAAWYPRLAGLSEFALDLTVRVPPGQLAVGPGSLVSTVQDADGWQRVRFWHPRIDAVTVAAGPWVQRTRSVGDTTLQTLFPESLDQGYAEHYLDHLERYFLDFTERAGPYPFQSFTTAASPLPVGYAFPGFTLVGNRVVPLPFMLQTSLAHELLHSWWGTGVRVDYASGNWSEGLTTLMADYDLDVARGQGENTRLRWLLDLNWLPESQEFPAIEFQGGHQGSARIIGYNRIAFILKMLRDKIGHEAFNVGSQEFNRNYRYRAADWEALLAAWSQAAERDVGDWARSWLQQTGLPELALDQYSQVFEDGTWRIRGRLQQVQTAGFFPLQVPLAIELSSGATVYLRQPLVAREVDWSLDNPEPAVAITIDPYYEVLRRLPNPPVILRSVTLDPDLQLGVTDPDLVALADFLNPTAETISTRFFKVSQRGKTPSRTTPTLLLGTTDPIVEWIAPLVAGNPELLVLARQGSARMVALPGTRTVLISADDPASLSALVRSLRHQGYQSFVVQEADGSRNTLGRWPQQQHLRYSLSSSH